MVDWVEGMDVLKMETQSRRGRGAKEGGNQRLTTFGPTTSLFSFWHMLEDVRFGGGGCCDVACLVREKVKM